MCSGLEERPCLQEMRQREIMKDTQHTPLTSAHVSACTTHMRTHRHTHMNIKTNKCVNFLNCLRPWGTLLTLLKINFMVNHADHNCYDNWFLQMIFCMKQARVDHSGTIEAVFLCARVAEAFEGSSQAFPQFLFRG